MKKYRLLWIVLTLLLCILCVSAQADWQKGDTGAEVLEINTRLRQLNYQLVPAGEKYTDTTEASVKALQAAYGLEETGIADARTLDILFGECYRPLKSGDTGEDVTLLQETLIEFGYYSGNVTGNYLEGTTEAVKVFQGENGLEQTGIADVKTQEMLYALSVRPTPSPTPEAPAASPTPTPGPYQEFPGTLSRGAKGKNVTKVQQRLMDLGFFTFYKTTENFMDQTVTAVKAFQEKNGLKVTGKVDEKTWNALFNDPEVADVNSAAKPPVKPDYFFEVDVNNQVVKVWRYNKETDSYSDLERAFLCATGTKSNPSPLGTFTLSGRTARWCEFPKWGGGKAQYWTKITDEIAFHSVLYAANDEMSLKINSLTGLGKRGSHGCIRLTVADAKWIYNHVEEGMQVWIHEDGASDPELVHAVQPGELDKSVMLPRTTPEPPVYTYDGTKIPEGEIRNLNVGKEGQDVYWLQMKLKELGFYTGTATGEYREGTQRAVQAYQRARGLSVDGNAGKNTLQYLYNEVLQANATPTPLPTETPVPVLIPVQASETPAMPQSETPAPIAPTDRCTQYGHDWGSWSITRQATTTADGERTHICIRCGKIETQVLPAGNY